MWTSWAHGHPAPDGTREGAVLSKGAGANPQGETPAALWPSHPSCLALSSAGWVSVLFWEKPQWFSFPSQQENGRATSSPDPTLAAGACPGLTPPPADPDMHSPSGSLTAAHHSLLGRALVFPCRPLSAGVGSYPSRAQSPNQMILGLDTDLALWLLLCICWAGAPPKGQRRVSKRWLVQWNTSVPAPPSLWLIEWMVVTWSSEHKSSRILTCVVSWGPGRPSLGMADFPRGQAAKGLFIGGQCTYLIFSPKKIG